MSLSGSEIQDRAPGHGRSSDLELGVRLSLDRGGVDELFVELRNLIQNTVREEVAAGIARLSELKVADVKDAPVMKTHPGDSFGDRSTQGERSSDGPSVGQASRPARDIDWCHHNGETPQCFYSDSSPPRSIEGRSPTMSFGRQNLAVATCRVARVDRSRLPAHKALDLLARFEFSGQASSVKRKTGSSSSWVCPGSGTS